MVTLYKMHVVSVCCAKPSPGEACFNAFMIKSRDKKGKAGKRERNVRDGRLKTEMLARQKGGTYC